MTGNVAPTAPTRTLVMAVPWVTQRAKRAIELAEEASAEIVWDQTKNAFDTWRSVLSAAGNDPVIILEDDIHLTQDWRNKVETVLNNGHRNDVVQFFSLKKTDLEKGSRYEPGRTFMMNQCYYLPEGEAAHLLAWSSDWVEKHPDHPTGYDITMATSMQERGIKYWLHVPSLVQHEDWRSEINTRRPRKRQSITFEEK